MTRLLPLLALLLATCAPPPRSAGHETGPTQPVPRTAGDETGTAEPVPQPRPAIPTTPLRHLKTTLAGISLEAVTFDDRHHRLAVADQPGGPGSRWPDARAAGSALGGLAAVNGGFFTPEGRPLGLVTASGNSTGALNRASALGAGFYLEAAGRPALVRRERFTSARDALQAGPFLVENARPVAGLSPKVSSARTFLATDGRHGWILARTGPCSLADLARALAGSAPGGVRILTALNLDGGRSSEIWVSSSVPGGPAFTRPLWNNPVRNFLVIKTRQASD